MASADRGAGPGGGLPVKDKISEADMDIMEPPAKEAERVGLKRVRDSANAKGFIGVTTAQKKPTLQPHNNFKFLKKAGSGNLVHPNVDGTSEMGGLYLHGTHGSQSLPDSNALSSSSPGGDLENKTRKPTKICNFYAQGRCKKGKSCAYLHEGEGSGSDNRWSKEEKASTLRMSQHRFSSSSPGGDLEKKTRKPTKICNFYAQGRCKKGKSCAYLHEGEGTGSDNQWSKEEKASTLRMSQHRFSSSSPGGDLENKTRKPTKICNFYAQGRCKKGKSCAYLHEGEGSGSDNRWSKEENAGVLAPVGYGNHRGSEEGFQAQHLSNLKEPQFENLAGSSKDQLYRTLIHAYGEDSRGFCRIDDSRTKKSTTPANELGQIPVVQEKNHEPYFMGHHISSTTGNYLDGRGTFPRLHQDGGKLQSDVTTGNSMSDSHVSRAYPEPLNPDYCYRPFDSSISIDSLQPKEKLSAYGGTAENLPKKHHKEHSSSRASYNSHSLTGFRNLGHDSSDHSLGSPPLRATSHLGMQSLYQLTPGIEKVGLHKDVEFDKGGIEKVGLHKDVEFDKGCGISAHELLVSGSPQPAAVSSGLRSPIKDEVWITSVPFVPSLPGNTSSQYDPLVDSIDPQKVESINNLKPSNISCSISSQHTDENVIVSGNTEKLLNRDVKLARNMSAKGSNEIAGLIASDRGRSSSLDGDNRVKACERKSDAEINNEKTRDFRFHLAEYVKELLKPIWKEGNLSKDAHKLIVKKSVDKVLASLEPHQVPASEELISNYITASGTKIEKLVKAYVGKRRTR